MSICKLKLGIFGFFISLWTFQGSMGLPTSKHYVLGLQNVVWKPRKSNCPVGLDLNSHNSLNMSPN